MYKNNINEMLLDKELYCARIFGLPVIICNYKTAKKLLEISYQYCPNQKNKYKGTSIYIGENMGDNVYYVYTIKIKEKFIQLENYEKELGATYNE